jgi:hypothetical protein
MSATRVQAQSARAQPTKPPVTGTGDSIALGRRAATAKAAAGSDTSASATSVSTADQGDIVTGTRDSTALGWPAATARIADGCDNVRAQIARAQLTKAPVPCTGDGISLGWPAATARIADGGDTSASANDITLGR